MKVITNEKSEYAVEIHWSNNEARCITRDQAKQLRDDLSRAVKQLDPVVRCVHGKPAGPGWESPDGHVFVGGGNGCRKCIAHARNQGATKRSKTG